MLTGWDSEDGNPYWIIADSHGIGSNDKGHIKWGMNAQNQIDSVYAVKFKLPSKCSSDEPCKNGGAFEDDCQCRCVHPHSGPTCTSCDLDCKNGGSKVSGECACKCPVRQCDVMYSCIVTILMIFRLVTLAMTAPITSWHNTSVQMHGLPHH